METELLPNATVEDAGNLETNFSPSALLVSIVGDANNQHQVSTTTASSSSTTSKLEGDKLNKARCGELNRCKDSGLNEADAKKRATEYTHEHVSRWKAAVGWEDAKPGKGKKVSRW